MQTSSLLARRFSYARFFGGILMILFTAGLIAGCSYSAGNGLYFLVIAFPGFGLGIGLMAKPWRYECVQCRAPVRPLAQTVPFDISVLPYAQQVATTGNAAMLDGMIRQAPLAAAPKFCAVSALGCDRCRQAGYLQLNTYTVTNNKRFLADKSIVEFGAHVGGDVLAMITQGGAARWQHVHAYTGIQLPIAMRLPSKT
jgi:hypothetical protein